MKGWSFNETSQEEGVSENAQIGVTSSIVGCRGASQLGGSLLGISPGYKANKL